MPRHSRHGFTLLEVCVCIGLLMLLMALVLPAFSIVRAGDRRTQCASNLNQLGKAIYMYADVPANGIFPTNSKSATDPYDDSKPLEALNLLYRGYIADARMFCCPDSPPKTAEAKALTAEQIKKFGEDAALLAHAEFSEREKASKSILALGPSALPQVREAAGKSADAEAKARLAKIDEELTSGEGIRALSKMARTVDGRLPKEGVRLSASLSSYAYDPGHTPNDAVTALMADCKGAGKNSDNHGANAGQNVLIGAGTVEWRATPEHSLGDLGKDADIYSLAPKAKDGQPSLKRELDAYIRQ